MERLLYFKIASCPYCKAAENWIDELIDEYPEYKEVEFKVIDEQIETELANSYDYYYVPTFFCGNKKIHEGAATKEKIKAVLDYALKETTV